MQRTDMGSFEGIDLPALTHIHKRFLKRSQQAQCARSSSREVRIRVPFVL